MTSHINQKHVVGTQFGCCRNLLKRSDERFVTTQAYEDPVFVVDVVRNVVTRLKTDPRVATFKVKAVNHESIHDHNAFAVMTSMSHSLHSAEM